MGYDVFRRNTANVCVSCCFIPSPLSLYASSGHTPPFKALYPPFSRFPGPFCCTIFSQYWFGEIHSTREKSPQSGLLLAKWENPDRSRSHKIANYRSLFLKYMIIGFLGENGFIPGLKNNPNRPFWMAKVRVYGLEEGGEEKRGFWEFLSGREVQEVIKSPPPQDAL